MKHASKGECTRGCLLCDPGFFPIGRVPSCFLLTSYLRFSNLFGRRCPDALYPNPAVRIFVRLWLVDWAVAVKDEGKMGRFIVILAGKITHVFAFLANRHELYGSVWRGEVEKSEGT